MNELNTKNANKTKEVKVEVKEVTKEIIDRIGKSYQGAIKKITQEGRIYTVELNDGYTCYNEKSRKARRVPEIGFIARIATEQKGNATVVTIPKSFNVKPGTEFRLDGIKSYFLRL